LALPGKVTRRAHKIYLEFMTDFSLKYSFKF
jgi:hypothetical protein